MNFQKPGSDIMVVSVRMVATVVYLLWHAAPTGHETHKLSLATVLVAKYPALHEHPSAMGMGCENGGHDKQVVEPVNAAN